MLVGCYSPKQKICLRALLARPERDSELRFAHDYYWNEEGTVGGIESLHCRSNQPPDLTIA